MWIGQVTGQCIFSSALDAHLRRCPTLVPKDAVAHSYEELGEAARKMMQCNLSAELTTAAECLS